MPPTTLLKVRIGQAGQVIDAGVHSITAGDRQLEESGNIHFKA
jgi:hypothetical protein